MADAITMQGLIDANLDVETLGEAANEDKVVVSRLGREFVSAPMASRIILEQGTIDATLFKTKADLDTGNALGSETPVSLVDDDFALVFNDDDVDLNGYYQKQSGVWVYLPYNVQRQALDQIEQAKQAVIDETKIYIDAVKDDVDSVIGDAANDVLLRAEVGAHIDIDFSEIADGTDVSTIGDYPLTPVNGTFTISSGALNTPSAATKTNPAYLYYNHPIYDDSVMRVRLDTSAQNYLDAREIGVYVERDGVASGSYFRFDRSTKTLYYIRKRNTAYQLISSHALSSLPANMLEWTFEVGFVQPNQYYCVIESPEGLRSDKIIVGGNTSSSGATFDRAFGVHAATPLAKIKEMHINAIKSAIVLDIEAINADLAHRDSLIDEEYNPNIIFTAETEATRRIVRNNTGFDETLKLTEAILIDKFTATDGTAFPSEYSPKYGVDDYRTFGNNTLSIKDDGVSVNSTGVGTTLPEIKLAGFDVPLPAGFYDKNNGCEIRAKVSVPAGEQVVAIVLRYNEGPVENDGAGMLILRAEQTDVKLIAQQENVASSSADSSLRTLFTEREVLNSTAPRDIEFIVRCYKGGDGDTHDIIIAEVDGIRVGRFFFEPEADDPKRSLLRKVDSVGIGINTELDSAKKVRVKEFSIGKVPVAGSSYYRGLPPEPAPVVPDFSEPVMMYDTAAEARVEAQDGFRGVLGCCVVPMLDYADKLGITPIDNYYMYYSSNHVVGEGGIWLTTAPTPTGPWTNYEGSLGDGRIHYREGFYQTEQPQVVYDDVENRLILMYHNPENGGVGGAQQTSVALSNDGVSWNRLGLASDVKEGLRAAYVRHDGYSSFCTKDPLGIVDGWIGWFRLSGGAGTGGGVASLWSTARSPDGITWTPDLLPIYIPSLQRPLHEQNIIHNMGYGSVPFAYMGQRLFVIAPFKSAGVGDLASTGYLGIVRMGDDMRNLSAEEYVIPETLPTETGVKTVSSVFVRGNTLYIYYLVDALYLHLITADLSKPPAGTVRSIDL